MDDSETLIGEQPGALRFYPAAEVCWRESKASECRCSDADDGFWWVTAVVDNDVVVSGVSEGVEMA